MSPAAISDAAVVPFPVATAPRVVRRRLAHDERPAVRLQRHGAHMLSDSELVALLTRKRVACDEDSTLHARCSATVSRRSSTAF